MAGAHGELQVGDLDVLVGEGQDGEGVLGRVQRLLVLAPLHQQHGLTHLDASQLDAAQFGIVGSRPVELLAAPREQHVGTIGPAQVQAGRQRLAQDAQACAGSSRARLSSGSSRP